MKPQTITCSPLTGIVSIDDLQTNVERPDRRYLWRPNKRGQRVHIEDTATGRAYCQAENCSGGKPFDGSGAEVPAGRRLCGNCTDLAGRNDTNYREPSLAVLMGERLAEVEPELFDEGGSKWAAGFPFERACTVAPKPWKREKQRRQAHRSKGRGATRSEAKYPRPFNDDLPSWWGTRSVRSISATSFAKN